MKRILAILLALTCMLAGCGSDNQESELPTSSITSEAVTDQSEGLPLSAENSDPNVESEKTNEPVLVNDVHELYDLSEYQSAAATGANITSLLLPQTQVNTSDVLSLLEALENGGNAVFEVYNFIFYDYTFHKLEVRGGVCTSSGWQKDYGSIDPVREWSSDEVGLVELLSNGTLYVQNGMAADGGYSDLEFSVYHDVLPIDYVQAYHKYLAALEFNGLGLQWQGPDFEGVHWDFYFELAYRQQYGTNNIWTDYPDGNFPAKLYEGVIQKHFPVTTEQLRLQQDYNANADTYRYEGGRGGAYFVVTRVLEVSEQDGNTLIRYSFDSMTDDFSYEIEIVDGVQRIKRGDQEYLMTVENTEDGFYYLSNEIL